MKGGRRIHRAADNDRLEGMACSAVPEKKGIRMRVRFFTVLTALALAVAVVAAFGTGAGARPAPKPSAVHHGKAQVGVRPHGVAKVLYDQNSDDNGIGISSQDFEASFDAFDAQGADNFKIKQTLTKVNEVVVTGVYFNGSGPAASVNVTFYKNSGGAPGSVSAAFTGLAYTDLGFGSFDVKTPTLKLKKGTYWVSVQARMDFSAGGQWGWETRNTQKGAPAMWQNPGDGFGTGCTTYNVLTTCIAAGEGPDFMFTIKGKVVTP